jgi:hypothetical protein
VTAEARFFDAAQVGDIPVATGYDGPGQDRVRFVRDLPS